MLLSLIAALALAAPDSTPRPTRVPGLPHPVGGPTARPDEAVRTLTVTARDYAFQLPDSAVAGRTLIRLVNQGPEIHHAFLMRLDAGKTLADLAAAMHAGGPPPAWAHDAGGPNAPRPGGTSEAVVELQAGTYVLLCVIPSPDGTPHMMKGMSHTLTVVPAPTAVPVAGRSAGGRPADGMTMVAAPDLEMTLSDYGFALSRPITRGKHVMRVTNAATQSHEVFIARLAPGKTAQDLAVWVEKMQGPPPGEPMGGTAAMARGVSNDVLLDLAPGEYGLYCFVPDAKDGKPHIAHGMLRQVTVR